MIFLADMVVNINVLEGKSFSIDCACNTLESILNSGIFLYFAECTIDLVLSLRVLLFRSDVCLCSMAACVYSVDVNRYAFILLN